MHNVSNLNTCSFEKLGELVSMNKEIALGLLEIEAKVAHADIYISAFKINSKFEFIEPRLFMLNEAKSRLHVHN